MEHTPGPWVIVGQPGYSAPIIRNDTRPSREIAKVLYDGGSEDREVDANARLIAAAPALLAACVAVNGWILGYMDFGERPCPFCDHHHVHSEDCLYITLQAAITSAEA